MSGFFEPHPVFDFLTGNNEKNTMPWQPRRDANLTRTEWSAPYPVIISGESEMAVMEQAQTLIDDPRNLVLAFSEAHFAVGLKGEPNTWYLTLIVQRAVNQPDAK